MTSLTSSGSSSSTIGGHGKGDKPDEARAYAMALCVADVMAVLDELDIQRAHFVGISWRKAVFRS
jgi:pimeloyl-ACP methyl ester carboxylesterase